MKRYAKVYPTDELQRLARQLPVHKLKMTPIDYIRYYPLALKLALWERGKKILHYIGVEL